MSLHSVADDWVFRRNLVKLRFKLKLLRLSLKYQKLTEWVYNIQTIFYAPIQIDQLFTNAIIHNLFNFNLLKLDRSLYSNGLILIAFFFSLLILNRFNWHLQ